MKYKLIKEYPHSPELGIIVENNKEWLHDNVFSHRNYFMKIEELKNFPEFWQPINILFTTEDGVDIFDEKQTVFSVSECDYKLQNHQNYGWVKTRDKNRKYHHFSTEEKAHNYILMNKPSFSITELMNTMFLVDHSVERINKLKELVKSKL